MIWMWIVFTITFVSHVGLIIIFEKQRKKIMSLRSLIKRQKQQIQRIESELRIASKQLFK